MTRIETSAPGKLVLLGEYAVLEGAPALVLAVDRRARITLTPVAGNAWQIVSPTLDLEASLHLRDTGIAWTDTPPPQLDWLATLFAQIPFARALPPCRIELDSDCFHIVHANERVKLGLGSSAALTVALLGALHALAGQPAPTLAECVGIHRAIQHGRGSGIDIAASLHGGLACFRLDADRAPRRDALAWPAGLHWCCVFSGKPASTEAMLATVAAWREREPTDYTRRMNELATISSRGVDAVALHDAAALLSDLHDYAIALARLGEASGADIVSRAHRELGTIATQYGCVYKSCGAGGGDAGITFAVEDRRLREFAARAAQAGFPVIGLGTDPRGLHVDVND
ncbi:MAG: mevalonate kinase family protein [Rhodanobacteraceae bacterium]